MSEKRPQKMEEFKRLLEQKRMAQVNHSGEKRRKIESDADSSSRRGGEKRENKREARDERDERRERDRDKSSSRAGNGKERDAKERVGKDREGKDRDVGKKREYLTTSGLNRGLKEIKVVSSKDAIKDSSRETQKDSNKDSSREGNRRDTPKDSKDNNSKDNSRREKDDSSRRDKDSNRDKESNRDKDRTKDRKDRDGRDSIGKERDGRDSVGKDRDGKESSGKERDGKESSGKERDGKESGNSRKDSSKEASTKRENSARDSISKVSPSTKDANGKDTSNAGSKENGKEGKNSSKDKDGKESVKDGKDSAKDGKDSAKDGKDSAKEVNKVSSKDSNGKDVKKKDEEDQAKKNQCRKNVLLKLLDAAKDALQKCQSELKTFQDMLVGPKDPPLKRSQFTEKISSVEGKIRDYKEKAAKVHSNADKTKTHKAWCLSEFKPTEREFAKFTELDFPEAKKTWSRKERSLTMSGFERLGLNELERYFDADKRGSSKDDKRDGGRNRDTKDDGERKEKKAYIKKTLRDGTWDYTQEMIPDAESKMYYGDWKAELGKPDTPGGPIPKPDIKSYDTFLEELARGEYPVQIMDHPLMDEDGYIDNGIYDPPSMHGRLPYVEYCEFIEVELPEDTDDEEDAEESKK